MKTIVILYAGFANDFACEPLFDGKSACDLACAWADSFSASAVTILSSNTTAQKIRTLSVTGANATFKHIYKENWTIFELLKTISDESAGFDAVVYGFLDSPFYSTDITKRLIETKHTYGAEYVFADGYPKGLTPEVLDVGTVNILSNLVKDTDSPVERDSIFNTLKTDINAFEIETEIAPKDVRYLRVNLHCNTKRDTLCCERLFALQKQHPELDVSTLCEQNASVLRTLPSFYAFQIAGACLGSCSFCPYPAFGATAGGKSAKDDTRLMKTDDFAVAVKKIYEFSHDAVISLSLWGECLMHPNLIDFVKTVLSYPTLSLLIETSAVPFNESVITEIAAAATACAKRENGQKAVNWIVSLDATDGAMYKALHGVDAFTEAIGATQTLLRLFPGAVYPQFVRTTENESQMETFYRYWKEACGNVIIQKYDNFCSALESRKVADLTPVVRNPCWHARRDVSILVDGTVPFCKEDISLKTPCGNIFTDSLEEIWAKNDELFALHVKKEYNPICEKCDEYYTFNF